MTPAKKRPATPKPAAAKKRSSRPEPAPRRETKICRMCGATATCVEGGIPPGWSFSAEQGGVTFMCDQCARRNIRAIEGKLSMEWWE